MPHRRPASDASFNAIDWSPRDILIPYVLLAVSLGRAAHGYLITAPCLLSSNGIS